METLCDEGGEDRFNGTLRGHVDGVPFITESKINQTLSPPGLSLPARMLLNSFV